MGIYQNIYELIQTYIYGGVELSSEMELVTVLISTLSCIFLIALPFIIVIMSIVFLFRSFL